MNNFKKGDKVARRFNFIDAGNNGFDVRVGEEYVIADAYGIALKLEGKGDFTYHHENFDLVAPIDATRDDVNHPKHYTSDPSGVECIQITRHRNFNIGNAFKYLWRLGLKESADKSTKEKTLQDIDKAIWYLQDERKRIESE